jgi:hypothetical protein
MPPRRGESVGVKFFGQFLIERGEIDGDQLREALDRMNEVNVNLGVLAQREGLISHAVANRINQLQRSTDRPFGVLAVEHGVLSEEQLQRLLARQRETWLFLGTALVSLGHLEAERLGVLLDAFKQDQAIYDTAEVSLPRPLLGMRSAELLLDALPKLAMRIARLHWKLGAPGPVSRVPRLPYRVSILLEGEAGLELVLAVDEPLARTLSAATCHVPLSDLDEGQVRNGLGEFLHVLLENVVAGLETKDLASGLRPPCLDADVTDGHEIELATSIGEGAILLRRS